MKHVLVTGANGGIGSVIVAALEHAGYTVTRATQEDVDLSSYKAIDAWHKKLGGVQFDWIVCAHGYIDTETVFENQTPEAVEQTFAVNTLSLFHIARLFLPNLTVEGGMIFLSSSAGLTPNGRTAAYSASKAAVNSLAQALARNKPEYKFFSICPGPTNTAMRQRIAGDAAQMQSPDVIAAVVTEITADSGEYTSGDVILVKDGVPSVAARL